MPRFFFHVRDGVNQPDDTGTELASLADARRQAIRLAGELLAENADELAPDEVWHLEVTDVTASVLYRLTFSVASHPVQ